MDKVFVHKYAGILSAYGIALAGMVVASQVYMFISDGLESLIIMHVNLSGQT